MKWKIPETEEAWQEVLSAYLDGELDLDARRELESYLARDARRASQLEELRALGGLLGEWEVEAPEPDPEFVKRLVKIRRRTGIDYDYDHEKRWGWIDWLRRGLRVPWPVAAGLFLAGVLAGAIGMEALRGVDTAPTPRPAAVAMAASGPAPAISDAQAERLWRQIHSAGQSENAENKSVAGRAAQLKKYNRQWMEARQETAGNSLGSFRDLRQWTER